MCISDNGNNISCEGSPGSQPSVECNPRYGDDYCYVLYIKNLKPTTGESWSSELPLLLFSPPLFFLKRMLNNTNMYQEAAVHRGTGLTPARQRRGTTSWTTTGRCGGWSARLRTATSWTPGATRELGVWANYQPSPSPSLPWPHSFPSRDQLNKRQNDKLNLLLTESRQKDY